MLTEVLQQCANDLNLPPKPRFLSYIVLLGPGKIMFTTVYGGIRPEASLFLSNKPMFNSEVEVT